MREDLTQGACSARCHAHADLHRKVHNFVNDITRHHLVIVDLLSKCLDDVECVVRKIRV